MKLILILLMLLPSSVLGGWRIHHIPAHEVGDYRSPERVSMSYYEDESGYQTLSDALSELKSQGKIKKLSFLRPSTLTESAVFQKELTAALKALAPKEWAEAEKSSGNMHNPKMFPLRRNLSEAFLDTSLAKEMSRDLAPFDLVLSNFGQEKLSYMKNGNGRMIRGIFHVSVTPKEEE